MIDTPQLPWLTVILAAVLAGDALVSVRPPKPIRDCLNGVRFPADWWWTLVAIKTLAAVGLLAGLHYPGVSFATNVAVIGYFVCAAIAHLRARFLGSTFYLNCLGMLTGSALVLVFSYLV